MELRKTVEGLNWSVDSVCTPIGVGPSYVPDEDWKFIDHQGHEHKWQRMEDGSLSIPTIESFSKEKRHWTEHHHFCKQCGEEIYLYGAFKYKDIKTYEPGEKRTYGWFETKYNNYEIGDVIEINTVMPNFQGDVEIDSIVENDDVYRVNFTAIGELEVVLCPDHSNVK